jgi:enoyl-CoA hydratase
VSSLFFQIERDGSLRVLRLISPDGTNRLTRACMKALIDVIDQLRQEQFPLVITGNEKYFSVGADLKEISELNGPDAFEFSKMGQELMRRIDEFPAPVYAAISGYCMGGGLDLALACHRRIAVSNAVFGHRGAALGLITGWGGTQRLPRLIGKGRALEIFVVAEKITALEAVQMGLVDWIAADPVAASIQRIKTS